MAKARSRGSSDRPDPDDQQTRSLEAAGAQRGWSADGSFRQDILDYLADTDLPAPSKDLFAHLISRDWVFANLGNDEFNELKWELRYIKEIFYAHHPNEKCLVTGDLRAAIYDDPGDTLRPLSDGDKQEIEQLFRAIRLRLTRSKNMEQQRVLQTNISQTNVDRSESDSGGGLTGWLSG